MKKFTTFHIEKYSFDRNTHIASFTYSFDHDVYFTETIAFPKAWILTENLQNQEALDSFLFPIGLAFGISYYKLFPTREIHVHTWNLSDNQQHYRRDFYINGLSEFFYVNQMNPSDLCHFINQSDKQHSRAEHTPGSKSLVPIGWGKDSCVSIELMKQTGEDFDLFTFGKDYPLHKRVVEVVDKSRLVMRRQLAPELFDMNKQWYYNGHVSITGLIAFVTLLAGYLYGYKRIVMSNEKSANIGNIEREWFTINHQYSKSLEFEQQFNNYTQQYITPHISYFSLLRGRYEIRIAQEFCQHEHYFSTFSSCNRNFHIAGDNKFPQRRCTVCPKCAFVFAMIRPFVNHEQMISILGKDLYEDESLRDLYQELLGRKDIKPLECVGTKEEVQLAMYLATQKYQKEWRILPIILQQFTKKAEQLFDKNYFNRLQKEHFSRSGEHCIPDNLLKKITTQ